ncbi:agglutinin-2-like [Salvia miltiorrhiza]|uniref:agglutinin-2-like n=1 Tax=Salvia miltiorrhiza TaxID=226208 RepID=UPI0025AB9D78|nr:agglutinin-2-like [Salvia miltiorrhiza]
MTDFTYNFLQLPDLVYEGDAHSYLVLTKIDASGNPLKHSYGRIIHSDPVQLWSTPNEKADFETTVKFIPSSSNYSPADGLVFFMVPVGHNFPSDPDGGNLGIYPGPHCPKVFAVEFDIFPNNEWDPPYPHVGINIETRASQYNVRIPEPFMGNEVTLRINYVASEGRIYVNVSNGTESKEFHNTKPLDLSSFLPEQVQVGLAGSTGDLVAKHDVSLWGFSSNLVKNGA